MPNWVRNELQVQTNDEKALEEFFRTHIVDGDFDFRTIIPIDIPLDDYFGNTVDSNVILPPAIVEMLENLAKERGKERQPVKISQARAWNCSHWGCKWNASNTDTYDMEIGMVRFDTPWSPPEPIIRKLVQMYPHFNFEWNYEEEQGWGGVQEWVDGVLAYENQWDIPENHEEMMFRKDYCWACESDDEEAMEEFGCPTK